MGLPDKYIKEVTHIPTGKSLRLIWSPARGGYSLLWHKEGFIFERVDLATYIKREEAIRIFLTYFHFIPEDDLIHGR